MYSHTGPSDQSKGVEVYEFKKGDQMHLDDIFGIQGIAGGDWWDRADDLDDDIKITRDIKITIRWKSKGKKK